MAARRGVTRRRLIIAGIIIVAWSVGTFTMFLLMVDANTERPRSPWQSFASDTFCWFVALTELVLCTTGAGILLASTLPFERRDGVVVFRVHVGAGVEGARNGPPES